MRILRILIAGTAAAPYRLRTSIGVGAPVIPVITRGIRWNVIIITNLWTSPLCIVWPEFFQETVTDKHPLAGIDIKRKIPIAVSEVGVETTEPGRGRGTQYYPVSGSDRTVAIRIIGNSLARLLPPGGSLLQLVHPPEANNPIIVNDIDRLPDKPRLAHYVFSLTVQGAYSVLIPGKHHRRGPFPISGTYVCGV